MRPMVEFCINRLTPDVEEIKEELELDPEVDVLENSCLGNCEVCAQIPYAMVNGDIVTGETAEKLSENIRQAIKDYQKEMEDLFDLL
ncbi:YuzB family protein [Paludifilum halophilum]|uniref:DUF1450 domain-containing protein n=1 Tax=Paludifilum halophilum TaxID=1642702 RepID=A0A235B4H5_9BACL|nr:YuzB family protein [Paludifilum halophilum]OYD07194.1 hypothetical protein CHM34_12480 [Paludifilum halophilum]